jgi:hypothetical protein
MAVPDAPALLDERPVGGAEFYTTVAASDRNAVIMSCLPHAGLEIAVDNAKT